MSSPAPPSARPVHRPLTPARWNDLVRLFGPRGACGGCWCMFWRLPRASWEAGKSGANRRRFRELVKRGEVPGVLAYVDGVPAGWCAVAPRRKYVALERSRILAPLDDEPVWSVSCLFVAKEHRRRGLSAGLVAAAARLAAARGARIVESYPVEPSSKKAPDPFLWHGVPSVFAKAGFREVARRSRTRPVMRKHVRRRAGRAVQRRR